MKKLIATIAVATSIIIFCACGADDAVKDNGSITDPPPDESNQIPTITIEELRREEGKGGVQKETVWWRLNATPRPKTDLAVSMQENDSKFWVIIPKSKNSSEELSDTFSKRLVDIDVEIQILPLPTVSIVGKGVVIDLETLQKHLPTYARGNHKIPADYEFPPYKVGEPSKLVVLIRRLEAEFKSSRPPDGAELAANASLVLTFTATPANVTVNGKRVRAVGKTVVLAGRHRPGQTAFAIVWDNGPGGEAGSATINLNVVSPWAAEKQEILDLWAEFMKQYNDRKLANVVKLWTAKPSDFFYVHLSGNEPLDAKGAKGVRDTIEGLWKHFATKNDRWTGANMHTVWIRTHGAQLQGSAHGNNALRSGQSWAYFIKRPREAVEN